MTTSDLDLLQQYTRQNSEEAFATLINRHLGLVYSAALRQVRSPQLAEEVAQSVFTDLSRNVHKLKPDTILSAWLYRVTRRTAIDLVRRESRRQFRERIALEMPDMNSNTSEWAQVEPLLDEAMETLDETDRSAVLLRYFENKSLREVGQTLGTSDDAAQKRVSRAVERLREFFAKRGVTVGASGLVVVISANAVQAVPIGLAVTISTAAALAGTTIATTATATAIKAIAMTTLQKTLITTTLAVAFGTGIYEARQTARLRAVVQTLQQQQAPLAEQIQQLQTERKEAAHQLAALREDNERLNRNTGEMLRLRGEVAQLRSAADNSTEIARTTWFAKVNKLKQKLSENPAAQIPELVFVTEQDWLDAARADLEKDTDYRRALSKLRFAGEGKFAGMLYRALIKYKQSTNKEMPADLSELQSYLESPVDDAILRRWEIVPANTIYGFGGDGLIITQERATDDVFDRRFHIRAGGFGDKAFLGEVIGNTLNPVEEAFKAANAGKSYADVSQLLPYAQTPEQQAAVQKLMLWNSSLK